MSIIDAQLAAATDAADSADSRDEAIEAIAEDLVYSRDDRVMDAIDGDEEMRAAVVRGVMPLAAEIFDQQRNDAIEAAGYDD